MVENTRQGSSGSGNPLFDRLLETENRYLNRVARLPQQLDSDRSWEGVLFSVGGEALVAEVGEVREILNYPQTISAVPGTKSWVCGVANIRGSLLPVIDLQFFLFGRASTPGRRSRVLVMDLEGLLAGLLVDEMVGIKHFPEDWRREQLPDCSESLRPFLTFAFKQGEQDWLVFSMRKLATHAGFRFAAS